VDDVLQASLQVPSKCKPWEDNDQV
jgi:hypothetical protein